jgi:hypothetical protein
MIGILETVAEVLLNIGAFFLAALINGVNIVLEGLGLVVSGIFALLPTIPEGTPIGSPEWLKWANWFFPIGTVVGMFAALIYLYISYLAIRYVLNLARAS